MSSASAVVTQTRELFYLLVLLLLLGTTLGLLLTLALLPGLALGSLLLRLPAGVAAAPQLPVATRWIT